MICPDIVWATLGYVLRIRMLRLMDIPSPPKPCGEMACVAYRRP